MKRGISILLLLKLATIIVALSLLFIPLPQSVVERFYSNGIYPVLQSILTPATNLAPFAVIDLLLIAAMAGLPIWWGVRLVKAGRGHRGEAGGRLLFHTVVLVAALFLVFELLWGFNYMRSPLARKLEYDEQRLTTDGLKQLARETVAHLNRESATAHAGSDIDLLVHVDGTPAQRQDLESWLEGWSLCLAEMNYLRTGHRSRGLLDVHFVTDDDIAQRTSYAAKIDAATDAARRLPLRDED